MERTECIMMNIPLAFFADNEISFDGFVKYYQQQGSRDDFIFHHFINSIPRQNVIYCFLVFGGFVRMRVNIIQFRKNETIIFVLPFDENKTIGPRNWMDATGPISVPDQPIPMKGFRGFRYTEKLF